MSAYGHSGTTDALGPEDPGPDGGDLLAALLDGMDAALCAFDANHVLTHWNREAERVLGWSAAEAVGHRGLAGWAVRPGDAADVEHRLFGVTTERGREVHDVALLTRDGRRVLVRAQTSAVRGPDGEPAGIYCAFSEVHTQIDLERSIALSEALFEDAAWGVVLVDADLRLAVLNAHAAFALGTSRSTALGRPLGDLVLQGVEELESALTHVLADGTPAAPVELWVTVRTDEGEQRRCWRSGFVRLASPLAQEPVPLGVGWLFQDLTEAKQTEQENARLRFRSHQLHRAARVATECEDPAEGALTHLDFALAGFADHALIDTVAPGAADTPARLLRTAASPSGEPGQPPNGAPAGMPARYPEGHPALQCAERGGTLRAAAGTGPGAIAPDRPGGEEAARAWATAHLWPETTRHALCTVLRSRGRTLGVLTFLRVGSRTPFERADLAHAECVAAHIAPLLDLATRP
ncbi:PAS domain-containing protein [Streptomyces sp. BBFR102]|uniref:PAS domain-containing protein n=1 Tax=Streptomyces sp. BBFR102 TaxID=3448171 RepID=UPI003F53B756